VLLEDRNKKKELQDREEERRREGGGGVKDARQDSTSAKAQAGTTRHALALGCSQPILEAYYKALWVLHAILISCSSIQISFILVVHSLPNVESEKGEKKA